MSAPESETGASAAIDDASSGDADRETLDATAYVPIRASFLEEGESGWAEIPGPAPADDGRYTPPESSIFAAEEALGGAEGTLRTLAGRLLFDQAESALDAFSDDFRGSPPGHEGPPLDREAFVAKLETHALSFDRLRDVRFKVKQSSLLAPDVLELELRLTLLGREGSRMREDTITARGEMTSAGGRWQLRTFVDPEIHQRFGEHLYFVDATEESGLLREFDDRVLRPEGSIGELLYAGGGIALVDIDRDDDLDLYVPRFGANLMFRNDGRGHFEEVARSVGLADEGHGHGAVFGDVDGDGDLDVYLTNLSESAPEWPSALYINTGGHFTRAERSSGTWVEGYATAAALSDVDGDGDLDIFVGRYGDQSIMHSFSKADGAPSDVLLRNRGDGTFENVAKAVGLHNTGWTLAASFADFDRDGDSDLYVSNDFGPNKLFINDRGVFEDRAEALGVTDVGNGMGTNWVDFDVDGDLDLYSVNMYSSAAQRVLKQRLQGVSRDDHADMWKMAGGNSMLRNDGGHFTDVADEVGCNKAGWAWGASFFDYDADGDPDLLATNGYWSSPVARDL